MAKSAEKALEAAIGCQILTFSQMQTVLFEASKLSNGQPIGEHATIKDYGSYLCPNDLLLGRSTTKLRPFRKAKNTRLFFFVQEIEKAFWQK